MKQKNFILLVIILFISGMLIGSIGKTITGGAIINYKSWGMYELQQERGSNPITQITIDPDEIYAGEYLHITIDPGIQGSRKDIRIYKINEDNNWGTLKKGGNSAGSVTNFCRQGFTSGFKCFDTVELRPWKTGSDWKPGLYAIRVFDYYLNDYASAEFTIKYSKPKGHA